MSDSTLREVEAIWGITSRSGWEMRVTAVSATESKLRCTIDMRNPACVRFAGLFNGSNDWIRQHLIEEALGFARDLTRKANWIQKEGSSEEPVL